VRLLKTRSKRMERYRRAHTHTHAHTHKHREREKERGGQQKREREKGAEGERRRITVPLRSALPPSLLPLLCAVLQRLAPLFNRDTVTLTSAFLSECAAEAEPEKNKGERWVTVAGPHTVRAQRNGALSLRRCGKGGRPSKPVLRSARVGGRAEGKRRRTSGKVRLSVRN